MRKKEENIFVNLMTDDLRQGISVDKVSFEKNDFTESHRDEGHTFYILEKGTVHIEIDFQKHEITAPAAVYMHPDQVHRMVYIKNITVPVELFPHLAFIIGWNIKYQLNFPCQGYCRLFHIKAVFQKGCDFEGDDRRKEIPYGLLFQVV